MQFHAFTIFRNIQLFTPTPFILLYLTAVLKGYFADQGCTYSEKQIMSLLNITHV